uniref:Uncharacterized protein n=1 Tax=Acrobeloides nanus TaxID=290746 RepID=A0A914EN60_9BILA
MNDSDEKKKFELDNYPFKGFKEFMRRQRENLGEMPYGNREKDNFGKRSNDEEAGRIRNDRDEGGRTHGSQLRELFGRIKDLEDGYSKLLHENVELKKRITHLELLANPEMKTIIEEQEKVEKKAKELAKRKKDLVKLFALQDANNE